VREERTCPRKEIIPYYWEELAEDKKAKLEQHLKKCPKCREYLRFISKLKEEMKNLPELPMEPCPSSLVLSQYSSDDLDEKTMGDMGAHILYCDDCFNEMLALEEMKETLTVGAKVLSQKQWLSPREMKRTAQQLADHVNNIGGGHQDPVQYALRLLQIGQLAYRQLVSSSHPSRWEPLARFAHGALNQAVILLGEHADLPQYAEACYSSSLVCRYIARWTQKIAIAERSLSLLKVASSRAAGKDFASLGLVSLSEGQAEALIEELRERGRGETEDAGLVSAGAAIPVLDPVEVLTWLSSTYGVEPRGKKGLWNRIAAILQQGASMPQAYMRPRLAEALLGAGESVRDEKEGERLGGLCPGMEGLLYWPRDIRPRVWLRLRIEERERLGLVPDKPIQLVLWANVPPPEGLEWADWVIRGNCKPDIGPHQSSVEIPITQEKYPSVDEEQKKIVRNWICQYLVIQPPSQEMPDSR